MASTCQFTILCRHSETIDPVDLITLLKSVRDLSLCHNILFKLACHTLPKLRSTVLESKAGVSDKVTIT